MENVIRSGSIIYDDVIYGDNFKTGHNVLIREQTVIGNNVLVGTNTVIEGHCSIGDNVSIQTGVFIPKYTTIEDNVFLGPHCILTNDKYPIKRIGGLKGPTIKRHASVGAGAIILPGITIGQNSMVGAGSVVTKNVPDMCVAKGNPAKIRPLQIKFIRPNRI